MVQDAGLLPLGDIVDHLSIHLLYLKHAHSDYDADAHAQYQAYFDCDSRLTSERKRQSLEELLSINQRMWPLEGLLRAPDQLSLEELGHLAVTLRSYNRDRTFAKRRINLEASEAGKDPFADSRRS